MVILEPFDIRIPKWEIKSLTSRCCPFCKNQNEPLLLRPDLLPVSFCSSCFCWYVSSIPPAASITNFYNGYFQNHRPSDLSNEMAVKLFKIAKSDCKTNRELNVLSTTIEGLKNKRILEVGSGLGRFLLSAREAGAEVFGCDLSPEACKFSIEQLKIEMHNGPIETCKQIERVDAVIMRDLIEHPIKPMDVIQAAFDLLKPNGVILVHTPNGGNAGVNLESGKNWVGFRVDLEHLQYLSPFTVNWIACNFGMTIERLDCFGYPGIEMLKEMAHKKKFSIENVKRVIRKSPIIHKVLSNLKNKLLKCNSIQNDPRFGSYHLFSILRKC
jgi:SAM-dependent methyltransferase